MEIKNCYGVVVNPVDETPKVNSVTMELEQFLHGVTNNPKDMLSFGFALRVTDNQHLHDNNNMLVHPSIMSNLDCDHLYEQLDRELLHSNLNTMLNRLNL